MFATGMVLLAVSASGARRDLLDEMKLTLLGAWAGVVLVETRLAATPSG